MEELFLKQERILEQTDMTIVRDMVRDVKWDKRLIAIRGGRGVGKTTMMKQYIKQTYDVGSRKALYTSLDSIYWGRHSIVEVAEKFYNEGGELLMLDEVHKYEGWSREVKEVYDSIPSLRIVISGSSLLNILNADADLSRRARSYDMPGLSFREYLRFYHGIDLPSYPLEELLEKAPKICADVRAVCRPVAMFKEYLKTGYYPFYDGDTEDYYARLENVVRFVIEQELTTIAGVDAAYTRKLKAMLSVVASSVPFEVDISKLSKTLEISRISVLNYLTQMQRAEILTLLYSDNESVKKMQKPDKIYLQNPNILSMLSYGKANIGMLRETFAVCHLGCKHNLEYGKEKGDFVVDKKYTFEVGGLDKTFHQIAGLPDAYILVDDVEYASGHRLPLWLVGFLF